MRAGEMRHLVVFQKPTYTNDTWSHGNPTWTNVCQAWIALWPMRGKERLESMQLKERATHKIRARYRNDLEQLGVDWRIAYTPKTSATARYFNLKSIVNVDERNIYFDILAEEVKI